MDEKIECISDYHVIKEVLHNDLRFASLGLNSDSISKFKITKQRDGSYPAIITISGFRSEDNDNQAAWKESIVLSYPDSEWFHLEWNSQRFPFDKHLVSDKPTLKEKEKSLFDNIKDNLKIKHLLIPFSLPLVTLNLLINNFWHLSVRNSRHAGRCLATVLNACNKKQFILVGHSLGARVIFNCMKYSKDKNLAININEIHLLGGAVGSQAKKWSHVSNIVQKNIYNYYSMNDMVLRRAYRGPMLSAYPIGLSEINISKVINSNVTSLISGHTVYIENFHIIKHKN